MCERSCWMMILSSTCVKIIYLRVCRVFKMQIAFLQRHRKTRSAKCTLERVRVRVLRFRAILWSSLSESENSWVSAIVTDEWCLLHHTLATINPVTIVFNISWCLLPKLSSSEMNAANDDEVINSPFVRRWLRTPRFTRVCRKHPITLDVLRASQILST